jgi:hypothetical protein
MGNEEDLECKQTPEALVTHSDRSQKAAELLTKKLHPKGVFRFRTFEDLNKWKDQFGPEKSPHDPA